MPRHLHLWAVEDTSVPDPKTGRAKSYWTRLAKLVVDDSGAMTLDAIGESDEATRLAACVNACTGVKHPAYLHALVRLGKIIAGDERVPTDVRERLAATLTSLGGARPAPKPPSPKCELRPNRVEYADDDLCAWCRERAAR